MKIILENRLDFRQFQNLVILTFITGMVLLGMVNSVDFKTYYLIETILLLLTLVFIAILLTKKGLLIENQKLHLTVFLLRFSIKKTLIETSDFEKIVITDRKLSTNYNYSQDIKELHNWEPELNYSVSNFTIFMANKNYKKEILTLTKPEKLKLAIDFITRNTTLTY